MEKRCLVLDLDGTVYLGNIPIAGAVAFIQRHWDDLDFRFLSNNTSKAPDTYVRKLTSMGIPARLDQFLSPTEPLLAHLRREGITRAYLVGNRDYTAHIARAMPELALSPEGAQAVILSYDTELNYEKLAVSARLLRNGDIPFYATHPDLVCPDPLGPLPDVGSFLALYEKATGRVPDMIFGKPDPAVLSPVLERYPKEAVVMAGDRLSTDKRLAENAGIDFVLVLSGEATREDLARERIQPWRVVEHLGELVL
ncbi:MAG: HAD-IIA family hydrolase [Desulfovibrio sp.]|jgi:HAD superfamily hydrolase (TIGR01450 family)|nr:HAD-IIA family hydrolase [Desulfovibrio sp.]